MTVEVDPSAAFSGVAHPDRLVGTDWLRADWLRADLGDHELGDHGLVVVGSDEDVLLYETGHIRGAVKVDRRTDLDDPVERDYIDGAGFAALLGSRGISRDSSVIVYGDKNNRGRPTRCGCRVVGVALWVFDLFGHEDMRLLGGVPAKWEAEVGEYATKPSRPTATEYPVIERDDFRVRAYRDDVLAHWARPLIDVHSPEEYSGERTTAPADPEEGALCAGHIPSARNGAMGSAVAEDAPSARRVGWTRSPVPTPVCPTGTMWSSPAASEIDRPTPGSSSLTSSDSRACATTTDPGERGAPFVFRSSAARIPARHRHGPANGTGRSATGCVDSASAPPVADRLSSPPPPLVKTQGIHRETRGLEAEWLFSR